MTLAAPCVPDAEQQHALLRRPLGAKGSGAERYAAAMYFYTTGAMPCEMLEIYRRCAKFDAEDPIALAAFEGVALPAVLAPMLARLQTATAV